MNKKSDWQDYACDTTLNVNQLNAKEIAQIFYLKDTLLKQNLGPQKIFVVIVDEKGSLNIGGIIPQNQSLIFPNTQSPDQVMDLSWQDKEYIGALAKQPRYLYNRWEKLLSDERLNFVAKRDSIHQAMRNLNGSVKIISDLRSMASQQKYLVTNKTTSPISMHNFGLATDFVVIRNNKISNNLAHYRPLDNLTAKYGITWGGNFVGFIDPGHIQLFKNGAELLRKYPELVFEFEPYRFQYTAWMNKMINWGKEEKANDTKELLIELNKLKKAQPCACSKLNTKIPLEIINKVKTKTQQLGYEQHTDFLIIGDLTSQTISLITVNGIISYSLGKWM